MTEDDERKLIGAVLDVVANALVNDDYVLLKEIERIGNHSGEIERITQPICMDIDINAVSHIEKYGSIGRYKIHTTAGVLYVEEMPSGPAWVALLR